MQVTKFLHLENITNLAKESVNIEPDNSLTIKSGDRNQVTDEEVFAAFTRGDISALTISLSIDLSNVKQLPRIRRFDSGDFS